MIFNDYRSIITDDRDSGGVFSLEKALEDSLEEFNAAANRALARATGKNPNIDSIW